MHLGKFHAVIDELDDYLKAKNLTGLLSTLTSSLSSVISNPSNAEVAKSFKTKLQHFARDLNFQPFQSLNCQ